MSRNNYLALTITSMFLTAFSFMFLTSPTSSADTTVSANAVVRVAKACTLTSNLDTPHTATINPGTYKSDGIGLTTLSITCNDSLGYAIYAVGYTGEKIGDTNSTKLVGQATGETISTGTNTSTGASNWTMKLATSGANAPTLDNGYGSFSIVPSAYVKVAHKDSSTGSTASTLTTTYAAYINSTQAADTYNGKVKYTMVHPATGTTPNEPQTCPANRICYYPNGEGRTEGTMGQQTIYSFNTYATLLASNFSRDGYGFAGWSDAFDYESNPNAHFYGPNEEIAFTAGEYTGTNPGLSLYAVWIKSAGDLQDSTKVAELCGNSANALTQAPTDGTANLSSVSALTDKRDNQTYAIAKLADGNCWMIENLRLEANESRDKTLAQGFGESSTYGNFVGLADAENSNFTSTNPPVANSIYYSGIKSGTATINIGTTDYPADRMPRYNNTNTSTRASSPTANTAAMYSYGNYYTWHAAIADLTYNYIENSSVINTSLCPAGWHLPTGGNVTATVNVTENPSTWREFYSLGYNIMGSVAYDSYAGTYPFYNNTTTNSNGDTAAKAFRRFPSNFFYSGYFETSSVSNTGENGYYWSSTVSSYGPPYILSLGGSRVYPGTSTLGKFHGFSIRCMIGSGT